jgi:hypothetical protein
MSQKQTPTEFTQILVKGRIAETIFEQMLLATGWFYDKGEKKRPQHLVGTFF